MLQCLLTQLEYTPWFSMSDSQLTAMPRLLFIICF